MAENKYNLVLVDTGKKKIRQQAWYKERLHEKYIKSLGKNDGSQFLIARDWLFMKDGLDDFRDGLPPPTDSGIFIKQMEKGVGPNISDETKSQSSVKQPIVKNRFTKEEICFNTITPMQQQKRDNIDEIEFGLTQHPLALYPHLEDSMLPELFEDVVDILDPDMNIIDDDIPDDISRLASSMEASGVQLYVSESGTKEEMADQALQDESTASGNPYQWLPRKSEDKSEKQSIDMRAKSPSQDEQIKEVTKEFCDWVASLGGDTNNIEPSTVKSLFASGYETKPALSVPIHVVELTSVPAELRANVSIPPQKSVPDQTGKDDVSAGPKPWHNPSGPANKYEPSWVKFRYGAWYLPTKEWRKLRDDEPLRDPEVVKDTKQNEAKIRSEKLNADLATMHGSRSFVEFVNKKGGRKPEFLKQVEDIQRRAELEERLKAEGDVRGRRREPVPAPVPAPN